MGPHGPALWLPSQLSVVFPIVGGSDALARVRLSTITVRIWLLGKQSEQAGGHECSPPDQVEVEPGLTEKRKAELTIECPGDQSCDGKIPDRVDSCSENPC